MYILPINIFTFSKLILALELAAQLVVVITESISNSQFRRFPPTSVMMGYTGQSLLVIIVSILIILMTLLVLRNLGRVLVQTSWKISVSCIGFSLASIAFRTFSAWFVLSPSDAYYVSSYNITSYFIIVGALIWVPFIFCKSSNYLPDTANVDAERYMIRSTRGERRLYTHRPHQDEDNRSIITNGAGEALPSYYEMVSPPLYKNLTPPVVANGTSSNDLSQPNIDSHSSSNINDAPDETDVDNLEIADTSRRIEVTVNSEDRTTTTTSPSIDDATVVDMGNNNLPSTTSINNNEQQQSIYPSGQLQSSSSNERYVNDNNDASLVDPVLRST